MPVELLELDCLCGLSQPTSSGSSFFFCEFIVVVIMSLSCLFWLVGVSDGGVLET